MSWLTGLLSSLLTDVIKKLATALKEWLESLYNRLMKKKAEEVQQTTDAAKYEEVINKPDVTREEQAQAEDDLLNRRH